MNSCRNLRRKDFSALRDLNDFNEINIVPSIVTVSLDQLNDGSGIAATLGSHNAMSHKTSRSYCSSSRGKRLRQKQETRAQEEEGMCYLTTHSTHFIYVTFYYMASDILW